MRVTTKVLAQYQEYIADTTVDLKHQYEITREKLEVIAAMRHGGGICSPEEQDILDTLAGARQCIKICLQVSKNIEEAQSEVSSVADTPSRGRESTGPGNDSISSFAELLTVDVLKRCRLDIQGATDQMQKRMIIERNGSSQDDPARRSASDNQDSDADSLKAELESVNSRLDYLSQASSRTDKYRTNHYEDISIGDDGHQNIVSTFGDLINAKRITTGSGSTFLMGQMSDESLQQPSKDRWGSQKQDSSTEARTAGSRIEFHNRYGAGKHLGGDRLP